MPNTTPIKNALETAYALAAIEYETGNLPAVAYYLTRAEQIESDLLSCGVLVIGGAR